MEENRIPLTPSILKLDAHLHEQTKQAKNKMKVRLNNNRRKKIPKLQLIDESSSSIGPYGVPCTQHSDAGGHTNTFTAIAVRKGKPIRSEDIVVMELFYTPVEYATRFDLCSLQPKTWISGSGMHGHADALGERTTVDGLDAILDELAYIMHKVSCELSCKCSSGADAHATTMAILNMLSNYSWDAKVVISLAAFAVNYGQFWLVTQLVTSNQLAKSVALLKQLPDIIEHASTLKSRFHAIKNLIKVLLDVTKCIV
ncbi:Protein SIEVE ELEMENT OCCLUSION B [Camellia lanceoleosa]|uniref:Protein SIEVE ELEMENT OCCLUSION B n=1 Tax=Camellia lanceoleosa TaxID=1840588 RepID=A0ACC0INR1_9ERIC|nr:Protein SIEVE ELEMENT OCCLUSION B [Camellia lanceoleosa]